MPTTAGTGSEVARGAIVIVDDGRKLGFHSWHLMPKAAILDPDLTITQPARVTRVTGIDALTHALESAVCKKRNDISVAYSRAAFALLSRNFLTVLRDPGNHEARAAMLLGSAFAGTAIENSMLGAAHSAANPLTAHFGIVHGEAVGLMLPHIMRLNLTDPDAWFIITDADEGLLSLWRREVDIEQDNDFDTENAKAKATMRFSAGWGDWRAAFGTEGA